MRAPNGNILYRGTTGDDSFDFSGLSQYGYGVDYVTAGGRDKVIGTDYDDNFTLGADAEYIDGGRGSDTVIYANSTTGVSVNLNYTVQSGGFAQGDELVGIENVTGSLYTDMLVGNAAANILDGQGGNDKILGGGGNDTLLGGDGNDFLSGDAGNDRLYGGTGNDTLRGGAGADVLDGGTGIDTVDYSNAPQSEFGWSVVVNLTTGVGSSGDAEGDTYINIENIRGSGYDDRLFGDDGKNTISGGGGNDIIGGVAGNDTLDGGAGDDVINGGEGADVMDGGTGIDTLSYDSSAAAVKVNLASGTGDGGDATGDSFKGFENLTGSGYYSDVLLGSAGDNRISGLGGSDTIDGRDGNDVLSGGGGNDVLTGGAGADTFVFSNVGWDSRFPGADTVTDFEIGQDHLQFYGPDSLDHLTMEQIGADTVIHFEGGGYGEPGSVTLVGVDLNDLLQHAQTDFLFA